MSTGTTTTRDPDRSDRDGREPDLRLLARPDAPFTHAAFVYGRDEEYVDVLTPFVRAGLAADDLVVVLTAPARMDLLRDELGNDGSAVEFGDMLHLGRNPARILPVWEAAIERADAEGRRARGVIEPVHAVRSPHEIAECIQHEAILNIAFDPGPRWTLLCPYDRRVLPPDVVDAAERTHPVVADAHGLRRSDRYDVDLRRAHLLAEPPLPPAPVDAAAMTFDAADLRTVRRTVALVARTRGIDDRAAHDLELAISEIATNSVMHGGGRGRLRWWIESGSLVCEVTDAGRLGDPLAGRRRPSAASIGGYGLWLANSVCDLVQLRSTTGGTTIRLHMHLPR